MSQERPPLPPFDEASARAKVLGAEAAWNTRDPDRVAGAYSLDSEWRNRDTFLRGRDEIRDFLAGKWERELDYDLRKDLWTFHGNRIAVRFQYESGGSLPACEDRYFSTAAFWNAPCGNIDEKPEPLPNCVEAISSPMLEDVNAVAPAKTRNTGSGGEWGTKHQER